MTSILEKSVEKCLQISYIKILKKHLRKATIQRTNSFFRMVIHHKIAERQVMAKKFNIPARSPDMNLTENVINYVRTKLHEESLNGNITFENLSFRFTILIVFYQFSIAAIQRYSLK